jgi:hypothetical protein
MNFFDLHERLRLELLRRIDRGGLTGALLARQTGFRQSHISNFLHRKRTLSLGGMDRILAAQMLSIADLLPGSPRPTPPKAQSAGPLPPFAVPLVTHAAAIHEASPASASRIDVLQVPAPLLEHMRSRRAPSRRGWLRFVAIRVSPQQAAGMDPVLVPNATVVIDRHYNSLQDYRSPQPSLFAVRAGNALVLRHAHFELNRLVLRPVNLTLPVHLLALGPHEMPSDLIVGRLCLILAEL